MKQTQKKNKSKINSIQTSKNNKKLSKNQLNQNVNNENNKSFNSSINKKSNLNQECNKHKQNIQKQKEQTLIKNIQIEFDNFIQIVENVNLINCVNQINKSLSVSKLINFIEKQFNIFIKDKLLKFYLQEGQIWLTVPKKKAFVNFNIDSDDWLQFPSIKIQLFTDKELIDVVMEQGQGESQQQNNPQQQIYQNGDQIQSQDIVPQGKCRRLKQRKIKHVIEKVLKWRQLYAGISNNQQYENNRVPLQQGAKLVKISKKTLDDYLSQIKKGKKYGFNFNDHKNQKIGVLRQFIRKIQRKK